MPVLGVGVDQAWDRASVADLIAYRATFVCRYLGEDVSGKNLTRGEADAYLAVGIAIVSNYEYNPGAYLLGYAEGVRVAQIADAQHRACGGPPDRPIYFSIDKDVVTAYEFAQARAYARGIASVIGLARTGAYAEHDVIRDLFDNGLITWGWQTYAWSGQPTRWDSRAQLRQVANGVMLAGHDVDRDEQWAADFGQWPYDGGELMATASEVINAWSGGFDVTKDGTNVEPVKWRRRDEAWQASINARLDADAVRDQAVAASINGLVTAITAGGGSVDAAPIVAAVNAVRDEARTQFAALHAENAKLQAQVAAYQAKEAAAAKAAADALASPQG